ncbi:unnamed protein product [Effrenium voratum]|nr:unnamed protein product [Effrenium voratum]
MSWTVQEVLCELQASEKLLKVRPAQSMENTLMDQLQTKFGNLANLQPSDMVTCHEALDNLTLPDRCRESLRTTLDGLAVGATGSNVEAQLTAVAQTCNSFHKYLTDADAAQLQTCSIWEGTSCLPARVRQMGIKGMKDPVQLTKKHLDAAYSGEKPAKKEFPQLEKAAATASTNLPAKMDDEAAACLGLLNFLGKATGILNASDPTLQFLKNPGGQVVQQPAAQSQWPAQASAPLQLVDKPAAGTATIAEASPPKPTVAARSTRKTLEDFEDENLQKLLEREEARGEAKKQKKTKADAADSTDPKKSKKEADAADDRAGSKA